jgi:hypothetical protein
MRIVLEPGLQVDAINSEVDVALGREITLFPARVLIGPRFLQAGGRRSRQAGGQLFRAAPSACLRIRRSKRRPGTGSKQHFEALTGYTLDEKPWRVMLGLFAPPSFVWPLVMRLSKWRLRSQRVTLRSATSATFVP